MPVNRPVKFLAAAGVAATLLGGGVATASTSSSGPTNSSSPTTAPAQVQVTNFPATQNVAGSVSVSNLPTSQEVTGTVNVGNFPASQNVAGTVNVGNLPATQNVAGTVGAQQSGTWNVGITGTPTVKLDPASTVVMTTKTVPVVQHQYANAGTVSFNQDVSAYKSFSIDTGLVGNLPSGCVVDIQVNDVLSPDNTPNGWAINDLWYTLTSATLTGEQNHQTLAVTSPTININTYDQPFGCASNIPLNLGIYGRPN